VTAAQGSYCWGNTCADAAAPDASALPSIGPVATLNALFPLAGNWSVSTSDGLVPESVATTRSGWTPTAPGT
jgi:hypothetical protein